MIPSPVSSSKWVDDGRALMGRGFGVLLAAPDRLADDLGDLQQADVKIGVAVSVVDKLSATIELETQRSPLRVERYLNGSSSALGLHFDL